jgi:hypothetical protein
MTKGDQQGIECLTKASFSETKNLSFLRREIAVRSAAQSSGKKINADRMSPFLAK